MKKKKSILIVSGGSIDVDFAKEYLRERQYDHIVAADSGLAHCKEIGIEPTDILGDFDSLRNLELLEYYRQKGIPQKTLIFCGIRMVLWKINSYFFKFCFTSGRSRTLDSFSRCNESSGHAYMEI